MMSTDFVLSATSLDNILSVMLQTGAPRPARAAAARGPGRFTLSSCSLEALLSSEVAELPQESDDDQLTVNPFSEVISSSAPYAALEFPFDYTAGNTLHQQEASPSSVSYQSFPHDTIATMHDLASLHDVDINTVTVAAFALCISKHCQAQRIIIGCQVQQDTVIPLSVEFVGSDLSSVLHSINSQITATRRNPHTGMYLQNILDESQLKSAFAQIMVSIVPSATVPSDANLALSFDSATGACMWVYNPDLFDPSTVERVHTRMLTLMAAGSAISLDSSMVSSEESVDIRAYECGPARAVDHVSPHICVMEHAMRTPDKTAVVDQDGSAMTYASLNAAANVLADRLLRCDRTGTDLRVAVMLPRSLNLFIALVGALKAGGAYVPVDPTYPEARIQYILEDSGSSVIIFSTEHAHLIPADFAGTRICITDMHTELHSPSESAVELSAADADISVSQNALFCVLYTSGTTGQPKGVAIEHNNAHVFMANGMWDPVTKDDVWAQMSNPCFIGSFNDIWLPLVRGATSTIMPKEALLDVESFGHAVRALGITCTFLTPKMLEMYADTNPAVFDGLNMVQFAGEAVRADAVAKLAGRPRHLQHLYGCTERTGCISGYSVPATGLPGTVSRIPRLPIGMPVDNTYAYVLDASMQRVPLGVAGELYIGGPQITRGYLNREDATLEKFIANPFDSGRMYRTGDLARWLPDGSGLDLLGRIDSMVKIRGYRVELGEIESHIITGNGIQHITAAAVTTYEPVPGNIMLAAYVTPKSANTDAVRKQLQAVLPAYMVPAFIMAIDHIPLNHNGKLDKRALPEPAAQRKGSSAQTENQKFVVSVWEKLIGISADNIGIHDKFVELGGNSLMASRLLNLLKEECPAMQMLDLMESETPFLMAERMDKYAADASLGLAALPTEIVQFSRGVPGAKPVFIIHGGSGWVEWLAPMGMQMTNRPLYGIRLTAQAVAAGKQHADFFEGVCLHYTQCVRAVQPHGPYTVGGNSLGALLALRIAAELEAAGEVVERVIAMDLPAVRFDKMKAYATATSIYEKAPAMLAYTFGQVYCKDPAEFAANFAQLLPELDAEILGTHVDENEAFVKMTSVVRYLQRCGMPEDVAGEFLSNLAQCSDLFVDPVERGLRIRADVHLAIATDNRLIAHTLRCNGMGHLLADYGWGRVTSGQVIPFSVEGDHITMVSTEEGVRQYATAFDQL